MPASTHSMSLAAVAGVTLAALASSLPAHANLVVNGGFESTTAGANKQFESSDPDSAANTHATGWTSHNTSNNAYNFIFASGAADSGGATGEYGNLKLWGPDSGSNNGLPDSSPLGGNYLAADGAFQQGAISQLISGLTIGQMYEVGFWWAGAQQTGFDGATTDKWQVTFGSQTQSTPVVNVANHGFTGWMYQTLNFTANAANQTLSFLAIGTPNGVPPFALLDGVSVNAVPEPASLALLGIGLIAIPASKRLRKKTG